MDSEFLSTKLHKENWKIVKKTLVKPKDFIKQFEGNFAGRACFTYNYREYGSFENWDIALNLLGNLPKENRLFHERIMGDTYVKPFLDIEFFDSEHPSVDIDVLKMEIKKNLIDVFADTFKKVITNQDILFASCHRDIPKKGMKKSFHVVISPENSLVFKNATYCKIVAEQLQRKLETIDYDYKKIIDLNVYKKALNFRLPGHSKEGEYIPFRVPEGCITEISNYCVTNITDTFVLLETDERSDLLHNEIRNIIKIDIVEDHEIVKEIVDKIRVYHPSISGTGKVMDSKGFYQFNYSDRSEPCFTSNEMDPRYHDRLGFYAYITKEGDICLGCHSANCVDSEGKKIIKRIGTKGSNKKKEFKRVHFDETDFEIDTIVIRDAILNNAFGMANLFCKMYKNPDRIKWIDEGRNGTSYFWNGSIWECDECAFLEHLSVKTLVCILRDFNVRNKILLKDASISDNSDDGLIKISEAIINRLNTGMMHRNILGFVKPKISDPEFSNIKDINTSFLACKNGMVDLCTGELRAAIPDDNITKTLDTSYDINADSEMFDRFIKEITSNITGENKELYTYFKWLLGYALHGDPTKKLFIILYGPYGFNGKSLVMNTIKDVLGGLAVTMDKSVILDGPQKSAGSHSSELMALQYARYAILNDTGKNPVINDGNVKQFTGVTDTLSGREIFGKQKEMKPRFVPFISTNNEIQMNLTDRAMYERLIVIPFVLSFTNTPVKDYEKQVDEELPEKLKRNKEGTLKWLIHAGVFYHQNKDYTVPECVKLEKEKYNKKVNAYLNFIDVNFSRKPDAAIFKTEFFELYKLYCKDNGIKYIAKQVHTEFDGILSSGKMSSTGKIGKTGKNCYTGIFYKNTDTDSEDELS